MPTAVVIGGSVAGLATALSLTEVGYQVTVLERDTGYPPTRVEEAHDGWPRPTVPQAAQSHAFASLGVNLLAERAPAVYRALVEAGAGEIDLGRAMPPTLADRSPQPEDADLRMLACRRSTFEWVLRREVVMRPGVRVEHGATVRGLSVTTSGAHPRVTGVVLEGGRTVRGDIVVDCAGRRSAAARWLADAGVAVAAAESTPCDITYYTRFYRSLTPGPAGPLNRGFGAGGLWDHYTAVLFLGDNGTFSVSVGVLPEDTVMKDLRHEAAFTAALQATPLLAPWVAPGASEPISAVMPMGGLDNSLHRVATTRQDPVLGLFHIGDSVCTTNPAYGRGVSLALAHAFRLGEVLATHPEVDEKQNRAMAEATEQLLTPWYEEAVQNDAGRARWWRATLAGAEMPPLPPHVVTFGTAVEAAATDAVVWRRLVRVMMSISSPASLYADPEVAERVAAARAGGSAPHIPAPSREELVRVVTDAAA